MKTKQIVKKQNKKQHQQKKNKRIFFTRKFCVQKNINQNNDKQNMCTNIIKTIQFQKQENNVQASDNFCSYFQDQQLEPYLPQIYTYISLLDQKSVMSATKNECAFPNTQINQQMRKKLLKWIVGLAATLRLKSQTLHICVQLVDKILQEQSNRINRNNFQLLGVACLFISSKMVQIFKIEVKIFLAACQGFYKIQELFQMQMIILLSTKFEVNKPSVHQFLYNFMGKQNQKTIYIMKSLADLCIFDYSLMNLYSKHNLAKNITYLSRFLSKQDIDLTTIQNQNCFKKLNHLYQKSNLSSSFLGK